MEPGGVSTVPSFPTAPGAFAGDGMKHRAPVSRGAAWEPHADCYRSAPRAAGCLLGRSVLAPKVLDRSASSWGQLRNAVLFKSEKLRRGSVPRCPALPEGRCLSLFGAWGSRVIAFPCPESHSEVAISPAGSFRQRGEVYGCHCYGTEPSEAARERCGARAGRDAPTPPPAAARRRC